MSHKNYFTFLKNSQNYTLLYPFYKNYATLTPFLNLNGYNFKNLSNDELLDSEYEESPDEETSQDIFFDW